jgi:hypothetical protein
LLRRQHHFCLDKHAGAQNVVRVSQCCLEANVAGVAIDLGADRGELSRMALV